MPKWKEEFKILADFMDSEFGKDWRNDKKIVRRLKRAAKKKC